MTRQDCSIMLLRDPRLIIIDTNLTSFYAILTKKEQDLYENVS